jgi:hypothetical protein
MMPGRYVPQTGYNPPDTGTKHTATPSNQLVVGPVISVVVAAPQAGSSGFEGYSGKNQLAADLRCVVREYRVVAKTFSR